MKSYLLSKIVQAAPGTIREYYKRHGVGVPHDEDPDEMGVIVVEDAGTNHEVINFYSQAYFDANFTPFLPH